MISVCIPIYNFNVTELVNTLSAQAGKLSVPSEIIMIDDASDPAFKIQNEKNRQHGRYIPLEKNIGRAAIRNLFIDYATYDYLLFLDCDSIVTTDDFLSVYVRAIQKNPESVLCGGRIYPKNPPERQKRLRWKYGITKESKPRSVRNQHPYRSFMTNNFCIPKNIFNTIRFDERLAGYGHEDTLMGFNLKKNKVAIIHLDNPVLNGHLESNTKYLHHTQMAISNLAQMLIFKDYNRELTEDVALLKTYYKIYPVRKVILGMFMMMRPAVLFLLERGYVSLVLFDFYKLGMLIKKLTPFRDSSIPSTRQ